MLINLRTITSLYILLFIILLSGILFLKKPSEGQATLPREKKAPKEEVTMVLIPEGKFVYGISQKELEAIYEFDRVRAAQFRYEVQKKLERRLPAYYIDKYEVANRQYAKFLQETGHRKPDYWDDPIWNQPEYPVVGVGWEDARAYCTWAGKRLPTEEEWEKAARGEKGIRWPWGNKFKIGNCNSDELKIGRTTSVGKFPSGASPYGVHDMAGNVWEIVEGEETLGPWGKDVMRGGAFLSRHTFVRTTVRWSPQDTTGAVWLGFRCVQGIK